MKRVLAAIAALLVLFLVVVYFFIPSTIQVKKVGFLPTNAKGVERFLMEPERWQQWWPQKQALRSATTLALGEFIYRLDRYGSSVKRISIEKGRRTYDSELTLLPRSGNSLFLQWSATIQTGTDPFERIRSYYEAKVVDRQLDTLLAALIVFGSQEKNL